MKIYKVKFLAKIFIGSISFIFVCLAIAFLIYNTEATIFQQILILFCIFFFIVGPLPLYKIKIIISGDRIEIISVKFMPRTGSLSWNEITEVTSEYFLFPETGVINLIAGNDSDKKFIRVPLWGMPIESIRDILSHLPPNTQIYLYPYLKRKVEGKQMWFYRK